MTCEIAVMNREAVALAADSASSIGYGRKVFPSAEKLFSLSGKQPVGLMVYGDAALLEVPWETTIKRYRDKLGTQTFPTLAQYGENLIAFLESNEHDLVPDAAQQRYFSHTARACLEAIVHDIDIVVRGLIEDEGHVTHQQIQQATTFIIWNYLDELRKARALPTISDDFNTDILNKYGQKIDDLTNEVLEELPTTGDIAKQLRQIMTHIFSRQISSIESSQLRYFSEYEPTQLSGIVIAGFGDFDAFPSVVTYEIEGMLLNHLIYAPLEEKSKTIDLEDLPADIIPFAQTDMVDQFLHGVDQDYDLEIIEASRDAFERASRQTINRDHKLSEQDKERLTKKLHARLESAETVCIKRGVQYQLDKHWWPTMRILSALPKSELATIAETLVNLTSFKRRVSPDRETVGGPVDVALISRGDGFVWIKRKRYFPSDLNPGHMD